MILTSMISLHGECRALAEFRRRHGYRIEGIQRRTRRWLVSDLRCMVFQQRLSLAPTYATSWVAAEVPVDRVLGPAWTHWLCRTLTTKTTTRPRRPHRRQLVQHRRQLSRRLQVHRARRDPPPNSCTTWWWQGQHFNCSKSALKRYFI